ncbi:MAG: hypothetical protein JXR88_18885 [Clostridia bacterium]|nr:hypothetical protein [Clostridia bacterium]
MKRILIMLLMTLMIMNTSVIFAEDPPADPPVIEMAVEDATTVYYFYGEDSNLLTIDVTYSVLDVPLSAVEVADNPDLKAELVNGTEVTALEYVDGHYLVTTSSDVATEMSVVIYNGEETVTKYIVYETAALVLLDSQYRFLKAGSDTFKGEFLLKNLNTLDPEEVILEVLNGSDDNLLDQDTVEMTLEVVDRDTRLSFEGDLLEGAVLEDGLSYTISITRTDETVEATTEATSKMILEEVQLIGLNDHYRVYQLFGQNQEEFNGVTYEIMGLNASDERVLFESLEAEMLGDFEHDPIMITINNTPDTDYYLEHENMVLQSDDIDLLAYAPEMRYFGVAKVEPLLDKVTFTLFGMHLTKEDVEKILLKDDEGFIDLMSYLDVDAEPFVEGNLSGFEIVVPVKDLTANMDLLEVYFNNGVMNDLSLEIPADLFLDTDVQVVNLSNGMSVVDSITPEIVMSKPLTLEMTLDGESYTGEEITEKGEHTFVINGQDEYGNPTETITITFKLYHTPRIELNKVEANYGEHPEFKARIFDGNVILVGATVDFYINDELIGTVATDAEGYAKLPTTEIYLPGDMILKATVRQTSDPLWIVEKSKSVKMYIRTNTYTLQNGFVNGGGKTQDGHYSMNVKFVNGVASGHFHYQVLGSKNKFIGLNITELDFEGNQVYFTGTGVMPKGKASVSFEVQLDLDKRLMKVHITGGFEHESGWIPFQNGDIKIK